MLLMLVVHVWFNQLEGPENKEVTYENGFQGDDEDLNQVKLCEILV